MTELHHPSDSVEQLRFIAEHWSCHLGHLGAQPDAVAGGLHLRVLQALLRHLTQVEGRAMRRQQTAVDDCHRQQVGHDRQLAVRRSHHHVEELSLFDR